MFFLHGAVLDGVSRAFSSSAAFSGSAELSWGVVFDAEGASPVTAGKSIRHGFRTKSSWKLAFPLLPKKGATYTSFSGEDPIWVELSLKGLKVDFESALGSGTADPSMTTRSPFLKSGRSDFSLEATLHLYDVSFSVGKDPVFPSNFAQLWTPFITTSYESRSVKYAPGFGGVGGKIAYQARNISNSGITFNCALSFSSNGIWKSAPSVTSKVKGKGTNSRRMPADPHSKYGLGTEFTLVYARKGREQVRLEAASCATLSAGYRTGPDQTHHQNKDTVLWNVGARLTLSPGAGFKIVCAFDAGTPYKKGAARESLAETLAAQRGCNRFDTALMHALGLLVAAAKTRNELAAQMRSQSPPGVWEKFEQAVQSLPPITQGKPGVVGAEVRPGTMWMELSPVRKALVDVLSVLEQGGFDRVAFDALLIVQWRWISLGAYVASAPTNVFGSMLFPRGSSDHFDCAAFVRVESKWYDSLSKLVSGLSGGVEARLYIPFTHGLYLEPGSCTPNSTRGKKPQAFVLPPPGVVHPGAHSALPVVGKLWLNYRITLAAHAWIRPMVSLYGATYGAQGFSYGPGGAAGTVKRNRTFRAGKNLYYQVGVAVSPFERCELLIEWSQGMLARRPYISLEHGSWPDKRSELVCSCKVLW